MPISPRKNCPTLTIDFYHLKSRTRVLTQFWNFEIISINKKVTASQSSVVFFIVWPISEFFSNLGVNLGYFFKGLKSKNAFTNIDLYYF